MECKGEKIINWKEDRKKTKGWQGSWRSTALSRIRSVGRKREEEYGGFNGFRGGKLHGGEGHGNAE